MTYASMKNEKIIIFIIKIIHVLYEFITVIEHMKSFKMFVVIAEN